DLVAGDSNGKADVFVRDRCESEGVQITPCPSPRTVLVSVASDGSQFTFDSHTPAISADGRFVAFNNAGGGAVFVHDRDPDGNGVFDEQGKTSTEVVSLQNGGPTVGELASISADGPFIAFDTSFSLRPEDNDTSGLDVYVYDRLLKITELVSVASDGTHQMNGGSFSPFLSPSGRFVTFLSFATNLDQGDVTPCVNLMGHECQDVFIR